MLSLKFEAVFQKISASSNSDEGSFWLCTDGQEMGQGWPSEQNL